MTSYDQRPWLKFYDKGVDPDFTSPDATCVNLLEKSFVDFADNAALQFMGATLTFHQLDRYSRKFGAFLTEIGCVPGDVVGLNMPNFPQYLIALAGTLRVGCIASGVSPLAAPKEMIYQLNDLDAKVLVSLDAIYEGIVLKIKDEVPGLSHVVVASAEDILSPSGPGTPAPLEGKTVLTFREILDNYPAELPERMVKPDDVCFIQYTGGTTGLQKGVELTHNGFATNILQWEQWIGFEHENETILSGFPFFHVAGLLFGLIGMCLGGRQVLIPDPRNTSHICDEFARFKPTIMANVPTFYQMLLQDPMFGKLDFSSIKVCISGASPFPVDAIKEFEKIVGKGKIAEGLGLTETGVVIIANPQKNPKKLGTIGIPFQSTYVKLVDLNTGTKEVPIGQEGEIIVRGPQLFKCYHNKPEETVQALREFQGKKWLYTGDVAKMDEDGYFTIVDRTKDMINVSGYKVFSREVEDTLHEHPAIECCAIVAMPDPDRPGSELVKAVIQLLSSYRDKDRAELEQQIMEFFKENMSPYKRPRIIEFVDQLPLTSVGKVDKKVLR